MTHKNDLTHNVLWFESKLVKNIHHSNYESSHSEI